MTAPPRTSTLVAGLATTAASLALVAAAPTGPAAAAGLECQGRPVTIVPTKDFARVQGTDGPDVIHTAGYVGSTVRAGGGDDLVCATTRDGAAIHGETGDDTLVDLAGAEEDFNRGTVFLGGAGDDHYVVNRFSRLSFRDATSGVSIDAAGTVVDGDDTDTFDGHPQIQGSRYADRYVGTPGDDWYLSSPARDTSGHHRDDNDVIDAGAGDDVVLANGGSVDLGRGDDRASAVLASVTGGEGKDVITLSNGGTALGGPGADRLETTSYVHWGRGKATFRLSGGPGNDVLTPPYATGVTDCPRDCARGRLEGGPGTDTLDLSWKESVVDLAAGRVRVRGGVSELGSFERVLGSHYDDVIRGDARRNRFEGVRGDDVLVGRGGADVLLGGRGRDRADGGSGRDRCEAEVRRSC